MSTKAYYRKTYLEKRRRIPAEALDKKNRLLCDQFKLLPFDGLSYIHFYLPILKYSEPDTRPMMDFIRSAHPEISVVVSKSVMHDNRLTHHLYKQNDHLIQNRWGIDEPSALDEVDPLLIDFVIVPLLVCDVSGNRIGYGKGYYDRFLSECRVGVRKIGLSFFDPVDSEIADLNEQDVPLDACIVPGKTWYF